MLISRLRAQVVRWVGGAASWDPGSALGRMLAATRAALDAAGSDMRRGCVCLRDLHTVLAHEDAYFAFAEQLGIDQVGRARPHVRAAVIADSKAARQLCRDR